MLELNAQSTLVITQRKAGRLEIILIRNALKFLIH